MTKPQSDDLDAVRKVVDALDGFEAKDQERIIRWAREKLGLTQPSVAAPSLPSPVPASATPATGQPSGGRSQDIKSFIASKSPQSDVQFATAVAYYYRFEVSEAQQKLAITAEDLQDAARKVDRDRLTKPSQTLVNAYNQGLLDKAGERGAYSLNTVGENLVAMALPASGPNSSQGQRRPRSRPQKKQPSKRAPKK
jgi:hypothetical protein